jgi:predicted RNA-binding Zn-ribbon protein involved in translation (DUF1610 family)
MYSILRPELLYTNLSTEIVEHDDDIEVYKWEYDGQDVYRGSLDPQYMKYNLNVYSLYDENLKRIGIVEHDADELEIYEVLWFYDNPFARFYQTPEWKSSGKTLWSMLSNEAYQDCLEDDFKTVIEKCISSKYRLVTPEMIIRPPTLYTCSACGKESILPLKKCKSVTESPYFSATNYLYIDDSFVIYTPPTDHRLPHASYEQVPLEQKELTVQSSPQELTDAETAQ